MENSQYGTWAELFKIHAHSHKVLRHIIPPPKDATAMDAWNRLRDIFQDHQTFRVVTLEQEFTTTRMEDFPNASAYCQRLKSLVDQLVTGLTEAYKGVGTQIRHANPLPLFAEARSSLVLEERKLAAMVSHGFGSAMVASIDDAPLPSDNTSSRQGKSKNSRGQNSRTGRKGGLGRGSGCGKITGGRGFSDGDATNVV
ncbi:uncharacterized protein LOC132613434 [Lycium barbarum]|uniref:uncharacterized protein LOC132613434 n=1 Tax=Lycium barbarum TaxID=112863 RepID=UPI00293EB3B1|nr:uncharacterized protein LOC132613434 [Lycium barbarum]